MPEFVLTVAELNAYVGKKLAMDPLLNNVSVTGEVRNFKEHYASGHWYFTLKDEKAAVDCVMFRQNNYRVRVKPSEGSRLTVRGQAALYAATGRFQLYVTEIKAEGRGSLYEEFERLKAALLAEGLFDRGTKKLLPVTVKTIGVATSAGGAAIRDIIKVARARNPKVNILLVPCAVQGNGAGEEVARAIERLDASNRCDVILAGRGGGSIEDLWAFNEEVVARAIYACKTPVVSCVGHETDTTIADFVADVRAATPSNGAELAVNCVGEQLNGLNSLYLRLNSAFLNAQRQRRTSLEAIMRSECFKNPRRFFIAERRKVLEADFGRLLSGQTQLLRSKRTELEAAMRSECFKNPRRFFINERRKTLENAAGRLCAAQTQLLRGKRTELETDMRVLESLNPDNVKRRGYACIRRGKMVIDGAGSAKTGDKLRIEMYDGAINTTVNSIEVNSNGQEA